MAIENVLPKKGLQLTSRTKSPSGAGVISWSHVFNRPSLLRGRTCLNKGLLLRSLSWRRRRASLFSFKTLLTPRSCRCGTFLCAIKYSGHFLMPFWKCRRNVFNRNFDHFEQAGGCRLSWPGGLSHLNGRTGTPRSLWGCFDTKTCISFVNSR